MELAHSGALLGKMALVDSAQRSATATTRTDCLREAIGELSVPGGRRPR
jgi:hypothetical protein